MSATRSRCRLTSRALGSPKTLVRTLMVSRYSATSKHTRPPETQTAPGRRLSRSLEQIGFQETERPVVSPVEKVELLAVLVEEQEEGVAELIHLLAGLVLGHRSHLEPLDLRHPIRPHRAGGGLGRLAGGRGGFGPAMILELLLVLADLPVHLVDDEIDGLVHVFGRLHGLEDVARATGDMHGELSDLHGLEALVLLGAQLHAGFQDVVEMP